MATPNWTGESAKCPYCRKAMYPHSHEQVPTAEKVAKITEAARIPRKRGRPMKQETIDLLRQCTCDCE